MRWNNPLNTTQWLQGSIDMNSVGVKRYRSEIDGILATQVTLRNGYYPVILDHLRRSVPRAQWSDACPNLGTWGTGCSWLARYYGAAPGALEADMTPQESALLAETRDKVNELWDVIRTGLHDPANPRWIYDELQAIKTGE